MGFIAVVYGLVCYAVFLGSFLYSIGFVGNFIVSKSIDSVPSAALPEALAVNLVLLSAFMVSHFDLFGLRQVYLRLRGVDYTPPNFTQRALYSFVRHPIMLGFLIAFWATPHMSVGHLVFSIATTGYILVGIFLEERDLMKFIGPEYRAYREKVPMLFPTGTKGG